MSDIPFSPRVAFSVTNCICFDQRVLKMAESVSSMNFGITLVGRKKGRRCETDSVSFRTKRFRMIFKKGFLFYMFFNIRLFIYLLFHKFDILVANDLDTLLPNFIVSKLKKIPLVYDSHEYFTGVPEIQDRPFVKWVWKSIEKMIFPKLKSVITVCDSIADLYESQYKIKPIVVRNAGKNAGELVPFSRSEVGVDENDLLLIIQGTGINIDKGSEELIDAVGITPGVSLLIIGSGDVIPKLKQNVDNLKLKQKVIFVPPVNWETLLRYTKMADAGMILEKDTNLNYRYSLPNKLFDYLAAGIPVIASDLPETRKIILGTSSGILIDKVDPERISQSLTEFKNNSAMRAQLRENAVMASSAFTWESESEKVKNLYAEVLRMCKND